MYLLPCAIYTAWRQDVNLTCSSGTHMVSQCQRWWSRFWYRQQVCTKRSIWMRSLAELQRNKEIKTQSQTIRIFLLSYFVFCHYQIKCLQDVQTALVWFHYHSKQESTRKNPTSRSHRQCTTQNSKKLTRTVQKQ